MTRQEKIKAAEERIKELETLIKHLKKQNLFLGYQKQESTDIEVMGGAGPRSQKTME